MSEIRRPTTDGEVLSERDCLGSCRDLAPTNGILAGASSGAVASAAQHVPADAATHVLTAPDRGGRHLDRMFGDASARPQESRGNHG
nr:hypothetical protein [Micromonospora sp. DSM 115978]